MGLSEAVSLALNGLKQFFLEYGVGGVEREGHSLTAGGGHREGVHVRAVNDINSYCYGCVRACV